MLWRTHVRNILSNIQVPVANEKVMSQNLLVQAHRFGAMSFRELSPPQAGGTPLPHTKVVTDEWPDYGGTNGVLHSNI